MFEEYVGHVCHTDAEREMLTDDVNSLWERLNYFSDIPANQNRAYGLAVGRVQSGKTRNYIGLMFKAIDEGFNTIIILTSDLKRLTIQTQRRVEKSLRSLRWPAHIHMLTHVHHGDIEWLGDIPFAENRVLVGVANKGKSKLREIQDWMNGVRRNNAVGGMKLLVIDDESDNATPNSKAANKQQITSEDDVRNLLDNVRMTYPDREEVVNWISELVELIDDADQKNMEESLQANAMFNRCATGVAVIRLIRENDQFARIMRLTGGNVDQERRGLVAETFDRARGVLSRNMLKSFLAYVFGQRKDRAAINKSICGLFGHSHDEPCEYNYGKMFYVGYTATPFANLLNEKPDKDPLGPDFAKPLGTGTKYLGFRQIFGFYPGPRTTMPIVRVVPSLPEDEPNEHTVWIKALQDKTIRKEGDQIVDDSGEIDICNLRRTDDEGNEVEWTTLRRAIMWAFCTAAARRIYRTAAGDGNAVDDNSDIETEYRWTTMLFNLSQYANRASGVHVVQQKLIECYISGQTDTLEHKNAFVEACMQVWDEETRDEKTRFSAKIFRQCCPNYGNPTPYPDRADVAREIRDWFLGRPNKYRVIQINSGSNPRDDAYFDKHCESGDVLWFVCGGNAISRGLTLDGLTVSYYDRIRRCTAVDAIAQMGRWFGYRMGYELLPRIWMTKATIEEMHHICDAEEQLHDALLILFNNDERRSIRDGADIGRISYFGRKLSGRSANARRHRGLGDSGLFNRVRDNGNRACELTIDFLRNLNNFQYDRPNECTQPFHRRHTKFWRDVPAGTIRDFISQMSAECLFDVSLRNADLLCRGINENPCGWNVVVGNPDANGLPELDLDGFDDYHRRNSNGMVDLLPNGAIRLTCGCTEVAFLARVPDHYLALARANLERQNMRNVPQSDMRFVTAVYEAVGDADNTDRFLRNPTLLIDFVHRINGNEQQLLVQLSFYWHGFEGWGDYVTREDLLDGQIRLQGAIPLVFHPQNEEWFKDRLLQTRRVRWVRVFRDGHQEEGVWNANRFRAASKLRGNIQGQNWYKRAKEAGDTIRFELYIIDQADAQGENVPNPVNPPVAQAGGRQRPEQVDVAHNQAGNPVNPSAKALRNMGRWARNNQNIPHKMIRAFLQLANGAIAANVRYGELQQRCQQDGIENFDSNFDKMTTERCNDRGQIVTNGRVFAKNGDMVCIVPEVQDTIRQYINQFMAN